MSNPEFKIIEGITVNHHEIKRQQVKINTQALKIEAVGPELGTPDLILGEDDYLFPGFIDIHVHGREDATGKQNYKEDFSTLSAAAINGGVVAVMDMPNNHRPPIDEESYAEKWKLCQNRHCLIVPYAGIGPATKPLSRPVPYKAYMGHSIGDLFFTDHQSLKTKLKEYKNLPVSFHCEDPEILQANIFATTHEKRRPPEAEIAAVKMAISLTKKYQLQGIVCHLSTKEGMELILEAKEQGINIKVEVAPHHLYFHEQSLADFPDNFLQVNPPIRSREHQEFLLQAFRDGKVDFLATDHAPHTVEEKQKGMSGLTHLDTYGHFVVWLLKVQRVDPMIIARSCAYWPAQVINPYLQTPPLGQIAPGHYGRLTIISLGGHQTITPDQLQTRPKWCPFLGQIMPGKASVYPCPTEGEK